jgi:ABC-type dipeptide/oligopeptide/nickel transport system permease component
LLPVVTYAGELFAALISASVAVEVVFAWPGVGRLAYEAVFTRDYPLIQGVVLIIAVIVMLVNLAVDLLYAFLDPRVHHG